MRTYSEMRQEAWDIGVRSSWSLRFIAGYLSLMVIAGLAISLVAWLYQDLQIQTWAMFRESQEAARKAGLELAVPSMTAAVKMSCASVFQDGVQYLFAGIAAFGIAGVLLKAVQNVREGWYTTAFGGFRRPLAMLWLTMLMTLMILLWSLPLIFGIAVFAALRLHSGAMLVLLPLAIPAIVACLRYALAWFVKAENPELGANACLKRSSELMRGRKWKLFVFGLTYFGWVLLWGMGLRMVMARYQTRSPLVNGAYLLAVLAYGLFLLSYMMAGQAVFYKDAKSEGILA